MIFGVPSLLLAADLWIQGVSVSQTETRFRWTWLSGVSQGTGCCVLYVASVNLEHTEVFIYLWNTNGSSFLVLKNVFVLVLFVLIWNLKRLLDSTLCKFYSILIKQFVDCCCAVSVCRHQSSRKNRGGEAGVPGGNHF